MTLDLSRFRQDSENTVRTTTRGAETLLGQALEKIDQILLPVGAFTVILDKSQTNCRDSKIA